MKKRIILLLAALMLLAPVRADYWSVGHEVKCKDGYVSCQVLQMVMMGSFAELDAADSLNVRVHAASLSRLNRLTDADKEHFMAEFCVQEAELTLCLHAAIGHCLWADILLDHSHEEMPREVQAARKVALLFLQPPKSPRDVEDRAIIRSEMTDDVLAEMARLLEVDAAFLEHIFYSEDWRDVTSAAAEP